MASQTDPKSEISDPKGPVLVEDIPQETVTEAEGVSSETAPDPVPTDTVTEPSTLEPEASDATQEPDAPEPVENKEQEAVEPQEADARDAERASPAAGPERSEPTPPVVPAQQVTVQKVGLVPLVLGGAIAAALGFGAAWYYYGQQGAAVADQLAAQASLIEDLNARITTLSTDLAPVQTEIARLDADLAGLAAMVDEIGNGIAANVATFDERLVAVERAPGVDGTLAETAIASWEQELDALRAEIAAQQGRMSDIATTAEADLEAARTAAAEVEQNAAAAAEQAVIRAALARVQVALDSGTPYDAALGELAGAGAEVPAALSDYATDGVPTIAALNETFPESARAALAAARSAGEADRDMNPVTAFLRNQFDVRSVTPRDGNDPDAILSRAGAALADNRLTDALGEIATLPEVSRVEMADWTVRAESRATALAAVETLDQSMNN